MLFWTPKSSCPEASIRPLGGAIKLQHAAAAGQLREATLDQLRVVGMRAAAMDEAVPIYK